MLWPRVPLACFHLSFYCHFVFFKIRLHIMLLACHHWCLPTFCFHTLPQHKRRMGFMSWFLVRESPWLQESLCHLHTSPLWWCLHLSKGPAMRSSSAPGQRKVFHDSEHIRESLGNYNKQPCFSTYLASILGYLARRFKNIISQVIRQR